MLTPHINQYGLLPELPLCTSAGFACTLNLIIVHLKSRVDALPHNLKRLPFHTDPSSIPYSLRGTTSVTQPAPFLSSAGFRPSPFHLPNKALLRTKDSLVKFPLSMSLSTKILADAAESRIDFRTLLHSFTPIDLCN